MPFLKQFVITCSLCVYNFYRIVCHSNKICMFYITLECFYNSIYLKYRTAGICTAKYV